MTASQPAPLSSLSLPVADPEPELFRVTAIGSCRVVGPLRHANASTDFALNQSGVYGYCHSSAEALQQLRVLQGEQDLPEHVLPIAAPRNADNPDATTVHLPSDLYVVELSSAKVITVDGFCVQLNYLTRHFETFFEDRARSRAYWRAVREEDAAARKAVLDNAPARLPDDRYILDNLQMEMSDEASLLADIKEINASVPNALFVTHFAARKHDGVPLAAREAYLRTLRRALQAADVRYFDPSDYVEAFGQSNALKDPDGSLSHYSVMFEKFLCDNWVNRYIQPLVHLRGMQISHRRKTYAPSERQAVGV